MNNIPKNGELYLYFHSSDGILLSKDLSVGIGRTRAIKCSCKTLLNICRTHDLQLLLVLLTAKFLRFNIPKSKRLTRKHR